MKLSDGSEEIWNIDNTKGWHRACSVNNGGKIYVIGGSFTGQDIYEISHSSAKKLPTELASKFYYHSCVIMKNRVWVVSGSGGQGKNAVSFDLGFREERFEPILKESHYGGALVALNDEYLLISGGNSPRANSMEALMDGRTYWSTASTLPVRISGHQMIADPESHKMYSLGGYDGHNERNEIYMVDMSCVVKKQCRLNSPMWSKIGTMHSPRDSHVSVLYRDKIYSVGGFTRTALPDEYFSLDDYKSSLMSTSHSLNSHTAVLL